MPERGTLSTAAAVALVAALAVVAWAANYIYQAGALEVCVEEKHSGGNRIHLWVPGVVAAVGVKFVPDEHLRVPPEAREWLPAARVASAELARVPDATLVEVESPRERVRIVKQDGALVIDVDNPEETVHVSVPLLLVASLTEDLEAAARTD